MFYLITPLPSAHTIAIWQGLCDPIGSLLLAFADFLKAY